LWLALDTLRRKVAARRDRARAGREVLRLAGASPTDLLGGGSFEDLATRTGPRWPSASDAGGDFAGHFPGVSAAILTEADLLLTGQLRLFGVQHDVAVSPPAPLDEARRLRLDWNYRPTGPDYELFQADPKFPWEVARMAVLPRLALAHHLSGRGRYAQAAAAIVQDWAAQPIGEGLHFTSALEVGIRLIALCQAFHFLGGVERFRGTPLAALVRRIAVEAAWLQGHRSNERVVAGNHLLGELAGLVVVDLVFPEFQEEARLAENLSLFARAFEEQVASDGVSREQSATYGRFVADLAAVVLATASAAGHPVPTGLSDRAAALAVWLATLTRPDGHLPIIGDNDSGRGVDWAEPGGSDDARGVILALSVLTGRSEPLDALGPLAVGVADPQRGAELVWWYLGPDGLARLRGMLAQPAKWSPAVRRFPIGGYAVLHGGSGSGIDHLVVRCGPFGHGLPKPSAHSHADFMAPILTLAGHELLVDAGNFNYTTAGGTRDAFRVEEAHGALSFGGAPMAVPGSPFRWNDIPPAGNLTIDHPDADTIRITGNWRTTGGRGRSVAARRVIDYNRSRSLLEIKDDWAVGGTLPSSVLQRWCLPAGAEVTEVAAGTGFEVRTPGGALFQFQIEPAGDIGVERRSVAPGYAVLRDAPMVIVTRPGSEGGPLTTTIRPIG